jgi:tetratricopeptide (TPR) repeat protein
MAASQESLPGGIADARLPSNLQSQPAPGLPPAALLHALGKLQHLKGDVGASMALFEAAARQHPGFALAENDLGVALHRACRHDEALAAFDRAIAAEPGFIPAHCNRGLLHLACGRRTEAEAAFRSVIAHGAASAADWRHHATAAQHLDRRDAAETAWRRALELDPEDGTARLALALLLEDAHRPAEAQDHYIDWVRRQRPQIRRCLGGRPLARALIIAATGTQNTPIHFLFPIERFETIVVHLLPPSHPDAAAQAQSLSKELPDYDIVFNAVGDADLGASYLPGVAALCRRLPRPILNPPDAVPPTRRDRICALLAGCPGLVVPPTRRSGRSELQTLAGEAQPLEQPALLRPVGAHGGHALTRIEQASDIGEYLSRAAGDEHYLSQFFDYRNADGYYRKYRFAFIDRQVFPYHLAIGPDWLVHYWRTPMDEAWMKREEEAFLADYEAVFPGAAAETVREVARRLDLDCAGLDCTLMPDGRVLLFEANATMNLQLADSRTAFPYKHRYVPRIREAVAEMVWRRCIAGSSGA